MKEQGNTKTQSATTLASRRHELILENLEADGRISVSDTSRQLGVSEMTIRRDLEVLEQGGLLNRVHGGAVPARSRSYEPPFALRVMRNVDAKQRIAEAAAALINDGETVILDAGTTTIEIARALRSQKDLRVLTPSLHIATILADNPAITLMLCGGTVRAGEQSITGALAQQAFVDFSFDTLFLTVGGVDMRSGATEYNLEDAAVKRAAFASARRRVVVADGSKLGKTAFARICAVEELDLLITDASAPEKVVDGLRRTGLEILVV